MLQKPNIIGKEEELLRKWRSFGPNCAQLLDGWHADGTYWTEYDESVRQQLSDLMKETENLLFPDA